MRGTVWNSLKRGGREKRLGEAKILKREMEAGSKDGYLKKEGPGKSISELICVSSVLEPIKYEKVSSLTNSDMYTH